MFERLDAFGKAMLIHVKCFDPRYEEYDLHECEQLVSALSGVELCHTLVVSRDRPDQSTYVGSGKVQEIMEYIDHYDLDVLIWNNDISSSQQRNFEKKCKTRCLSRTELILNLFKQRARSYEGRLQIELAECQFTLSHLVKSWSHLDREKGGIGLRGAGEKQLELDQRMIFKRIDGLRKKIAKIHGRRRSNHARRSKNNCPTVALVGYTNAGKSTFFNALTGSNVWAEDQLFASLDPTFRQFKIRQRSLVLADTVGFISKLPHMLVDAFKSTLDAVSEADLLLHVIDISHPKMREQMDSVVQVLKEIDAEGLPRINVFNKIDLVDDEPVCLDRSDPFPSCFVSAANGTGIDENLFQLLLSSLFPDQIVVSLKMPLSMGRLRSWLYEHGQVLSESVQLEFLLMRVSIERVYLSDLQAEDHVECIVE